MDNEKIYTNINETLTSNATSIYSINDNENIYRGTEIGTQSSVSMEESIDIVKTTTGTPSYEVPKIVKVKKYRLYKEET